jgi:hypothetical protein
MHRIAGLEDAHRLTNRVVGSGYRLAVIQDRPAHRLTILRHMAHRFHFGWCLHGDPPGLRLPVEETSFDVLDRDGSRIVVGLVALIFSAVAPGLCPLRRRLVGTKGCWRAVPRRGGVCPQGGPSGRPAGLRGAGTDRAAASAGGSPDLERVSACVKTQLRRVT